MQALLILTLAKSKTLHLYIAVSAAVGDVRAGVGTVSFFTRLRAIIGNIEIYYEM